MCTVKVQQPLPMGFSVINMLHVNSDRLCHYGSVNSPDWKVFNILIIVATLKKNQREMKIKTNITRISMLMIVLTTLICDQISKNIVRTEVDFNERIKIGIDNVTLTKVENTGAFLSVGSFLPASVKFILLIALPCVVLFLGLYAIMINGKLPKIVVIGAALIVGGGIGNLFDRVVFGSVTDFLHIDFVLFKTGIFNVADMAIMVGMLLMAITIYKNKIVALSK